ncbi:MAG: hypothetical protein U9R74_17735 [Pseudomonadota bacterium]|nr:hypothetical protein [Pseudomonadota bacterium]
MSLGTGREGRRRVKLPGAVIVVALSMPVSGDDYLDALSAEAEEGGASVDETSVTQVSNEDLQEALKAKMPTTAKLYSTLGPEDQEDVLGVYRETFNVNKVSLEVLKRSRNRPR